MGPAIPIIKGVGLDIVKSISKFMDLVGSGDVEMYNEFSLQHELGIYLRSNQPLARIEFERNVSHFDLERSGFVKKEIDLSIVDRTSGDRLGVIELKFPRNGQVPEQMYSFCKDISFLEQLVSAGFKKGVFVAVVDDALFYAGKTDGIYSMFRGGAPITGKIAKPTGAKDSMVEVLGSYRASWQEISENLKWCIIEVTS